MIGRLKLAAVTWGLALALAGGATPAAAQGGALPDLVLPPGVNLPSRGMIEAGVTVPAGTTGTVLPVAGGAQAMSIVCNETAGVVAFTTMGPAARLRRQNIVFTVGGRSFPVPFSKIPDMDVVYSDGFVAAGSLLRALTTARGGTVRFASADGAVRGSFELAPHAAQIRRVASACLTQTAGMRREMIDNLLAGRWFVSELPWLMAATPPMTGAVKHVGVTCQGQGRGPAAVVALNERGLGPETYVFRNGQRAVSIRFEQFGEAALAMSPTSTRQLVDLVTSANGPITVTRDGQRLAQFTTAGAAAALRQVTSRCRAGRG